VLDVWRRLRADGASPDVVLVVGRFRVARLLATLLHERPGARILFDEYLDHPLYRIVETIIAPTTFHDRGAEFMVPDVVPREQARSPLAQHAADGC
jgi:hypothetical protein